MKDREDMVLNIFIVSVTVLLAIGYVILQVKKG